MCTRIKIFCYLITRCHEKLSSSYRWYQKCTVGPTFVRTESLLSRPILKKIFGAFYSGWYVLVHPYSNFSLRRQMAPVQSIKFQTANFPIFCAHIIVIFWTTCIARKVFSLVVMSNGKQVLPVLQWLEVVIAFVSKTLQTASKSVYKCRRYRYLLLNNATSFVDRYRCGLQRFFSGKISTFQ